MVHFLVEVFQPVNMPATLLLLVVFSYWLFVILGVFGLDALDIDLGIDTEIDGDADVGHIGTGGHGLFMSALEFFHLGTVPVTFFISIFSLLFWIASILANHFWNTSWSWLVEFYLLGPCFIASLLATKLAVMPTIPFFNKMTEKDEVINNSKLLGTTAIVSTSEVTDSFGQVEIAQDGPPIVLNVRCFGARLQKGDAVELVSFDSSTNVYLVRLPKN